MAKVRPASIVNNLPGIRSKSISLRPAFSRFYQGLIAAQDNIIDFPLFICHLPHMNSPRHIGLHMVVGANQSPWSGSFLNDLSLATPCGIAERVSPEAMMKSKEAP